MTPEEMKYRTKRLALEIIRFSSSLPRCREADVLGKQLLRSATSVGANYRSACRARSRADFVSKLGVVEEEIDEAQLWLELIGDAQLIKASRIEDLIDEVKQLTAIFAASRITARRNKS